MTAPAATRTLARYGDWMSNAEVAAYWSWNAQTAMKKVRRGQFPAPLNYVPETGRCDGQPRWRTADVAAYVAGTWRPLRSRSFASVHRYATRRRT